MEAVKLDGDNLQYGSIEIRNDWDVVSEWVLGTTWQWALNFFSYAGDELLRDKAFILTTLDGMMKKVNNVIKAPYHPCTFLKFAHESEILDDEEFALTFIRRAQCVDE